MSDYLKREDALDIVADNNVTGEITLNRYDKIIDGIYDLPSADVAPVVRCKDCKWRNWETNGCDRNPCVEPWFENDFCSYGERKDND